MGISLTASYAQEAVFYVKKSHVRFKAIEEGRILEYTFIVENKGDMPLEILGYDVECSCTSITVDSTPIPPGGRIPLTMRFDSSGKRGFQDRYILLETNTARQTEQLHFEVMVRAGK